MDLWQLRIFCSVVEQKSFSKAAKLIHLSQPTISSHIKDLENHFNCRLIDRLSRNAIPTKAGELLYDYAKRLIRLKKETETAMSAFHGNIKGRLVIGGSTIPGVYILPKIMGGFRRRYPDVTLSVIIGDSEQILEKTMAGTIEVGIVGREFPDRRLEQIPFREDEMCIVVPEGHPFAGKKHVPLKALFREPFIVREKGSGTLDTFCRYLQGEGHELEDLNTVAEMGSTSAVIQGIKNRLGISILSSVAVAEEKAAGTLHTISISGHPLKRFFYLTRNRYRTPSPICSVFMEFLTSDPPVFNESLPEGENPNTRR